MLVARSSIVTSISLIILAEPNPTPNEAYALTMVDDVAVAAMLISIAAVSIAATIDQAGWVQVSGLVVAALLSVRFFLGLTGFPRLGGGGVHIAHMLWGGGLMVAALLVLLGYLGQRIRRTAAVVGGVGFGLFIDELGKFITSDNNYFYRPAIALIYVIFVLLFLWWRSLERHRTWSEETYLANALMLLQDTAMHDLDTAEMSRLR